MTEAQAIVGTRVRSNVEFSGVPQGTPGVIVEDYGTGVMIQWDLEKYRDHPLRDGFDKETELEYLDLE